MENRNELSFHLQVIAGDADMSRQSDKSTINEKEKKVKETRKERVH